MEERKFYLTKKKVIGLISLIVWALTFVFACFEKTIYVGQLIIHTFGYLTFPIIILMLLLSLAMFMGLSYKRNKKTTAYAFVSLVSLLLLVHSIMCFDQLKIVVDFESMIRYLKYNYENITLFGSFGSIVAAAFAILLGEMGTIVVFGILLTLFVGLCIDYHFYGKYEPHVKKLKSIKLKEKVQNSDKKRTLQNTPLWEYGNSNSSNEVFDTITATDDEVNGIASEIQKKPYDDSDIFDTIDTTFEEETIENVEEQKTYFKVSKDDENANLERRKFMNDTWGMTEEKPEEDDISKLLSDLNGDDENISDSGDSDDISSILGTSEDDFVLEEEKPFEFETKIDVKPQIVNKTTTNYAEDLTNTINQTTNGGFGFENNIANKGFSNVRGYEESPIIKKPIAEPIAMRGIRYNPPPINLLKKPVVDKGDYSDEQRRKSAILENVLAAFNIPAKVQNIVRGPKITRYELSVPYGISLKNIPKYEEDIAAALSAKTIVIRAPIPGTPYAGIEIQNDTYTSVSLRELIESPEFQNAKDPLSVVIGKDISGAVVVRSIVKMLHLLVAGSTGAGKSVFIHGMILSLLYKHGPDELKLMILDPKKVEFNCYDGLPHHVIPEVVKGREKALNALKWCVEEMDRRYGLMEKSAHRNIESYNKSELVKAGQLEKFPYIVIVVDELADLMTYNKKDVELCIQRLTQLARACGIHLILATQRPSVDVISGVIKTNIPSRVALTLQSGIDSRTIINTVGAEKLLNQGDMLFSPTGTSEISRLQGAWVPDEEINAVVEYEKKYNKVCFDDNATAKINAEQIVEDSGGIGGFESPQKKDAVDAYFKEAVKLVMMNGSASVTFLQRRLSIGFARAGRIMDQMEDRGYVERSTGAKVRKVLISPEQFSEDFGEDFNSIN